MFQYTVLIDVSFFKWMDIDKYYDVKYDEKYYDAQFRKTPVKNGC